MQRYIKINPLDNVAVALTDLKKDELVNIDNEDIVLLEDVSQGHKFALNDIKKDENIIKYGMEIGHATVDIKKGEHVHVHNIKTNLSDILNYSYNPVTFKMPEALNKTFMGFKRSNGEVGIRNEIWIIPTVGCMNSVGEAIERQAQKYIKGSIDGIFAFKHPYGCSQMGDDQENTREVLADLINHPNAGGVLVLGLGCENSNIDVLKNYIGEVDTDRVKFVVAQEYEDEIKEALKQIELISDVVSKDVREVLPASKLKIGLKCGGSDGLSGITANPVVGRFSDLLVADGGSTVLCEVPEMFGAETALMNRAANKEVFDKTVSLINDFKKYFEDHHQTIYENPSPGNKAGGISTLEDKSNGCVQKSGSAKVIDVLKYGERISKQGLNLLSTPGNDLVAATGEASAGCQMVLFTTGRGTPFASAVPTVKIATNSKLANKKNGWIDFNAGKAIEDSSIDEMGYKLYDLVLEIASGKKTKSEASGYHDIAIFKQGVTL